MARGWPPPFLRLRRHRAVLHERGDFPRPARCSDRDARRPRPDPRAGADSDGRAHRLDGKARPDAEFRTLSGLRPWAEDAAIRLLRAVPPGAAADVGAPVGLGRTLAHEEALPAFVLRARPIAARVRFGKKLLPLSA